MRFIGNLGFCRFFKSYATEGRSKPLAIEAMSLSRAVSLKLVECWSDLIFHCQIQHRK